MNDQHNDQHHEEERLARLLAETQLAAAPVDEAFLAKLRSQTSKIVKTESNTGTLEPARPLPSVLRRSKSLWSEPMVRFGLALTSVILLVVGIAFVSWWKPASGMTLADSLASLDQLHSFEATRRTVRGSETLRFVQPAMLRIDQGSSYLLHRDGQTWEVNETENRASRRAEALMTGQHLNLAGLLHLPRQVDLSEEPVQITTPQPGLEERLYHVGRASLQLRWLVDLATKQTIKFTLIDQAKQPVQEEEFVLTAINVPVAKGTFQLKDTLTEDGRVGIVQDIQGIVAVRPVGKERWTPLAVGDLLKPGDLVRANPRGPNAARLRMAPNTDVTFGPGATLEIKTPVEYRLLSGEIEVHPRDRKVTIISPASNSNDRTVVDAKTVLQADAEKIVALKEQPAWLKGFQGTVVNESLGQLLAKVDDRNVPLNVGYHKVDVDIRDGLARTTVEESFINTTDRELEGTFFFPLPSDASIAGFGMWIGNELIEADIVEKQRAREIFDIILSEKKDPALLEWAGGNLFKTRVYPIPAHGEKRIKITYTQALPLEGNRFRYSYALLSDLLKQHPLKELSVNLTVSSAWPLAKVYSSTYPVREEKAGSAARLVFTAQEYVPTRDFEAVIELAATPSAVTMLPHRRGDDGYFLLRLAPPQNSAGWEREVVRDGPPLHVLILCDTSASIDKQQRGQQKAFVDALLGSLTAKDTFNLACFDVETDWAFAQQQSTDAKTISLAQTMLNNRRSMGWTDFEKAFSSAQKQAAQTPGTVILYLGDGIPAMSWGHDPKVLVDRLKSMVSRDKAPVHAVALGSTHEPQTLRAMANLSGGSWRKIAADRGPALQARDLLQELTDPNLLRDLKVSFEGLQTARVYPETLPNVQQGTGLVLTGRYLPSGKTQKGTVTVSGLRGNTPVKYQASVTLPDNDAGNSFIPRLWARQHIESLLESGGGAARDEIIARSEEFHLMTPYTSFLVLENDSLRERFAVKKRFNMRNGERFFADGKAQSELLLRQKQMKLAAEWRVNLQRQTLTQLATLGKGQQGGVQGRGFGPPILGKSPYVNRLFRNQSYGPFGR
ncbi:MAG: VIT and VWA domain-containing protein [Gemmatales bacterium]